MKIPSSIKVVLVASLNLAVLGSFPATARELTPQERTADFDQMVGILRSSYGMVEYKKQRFGIDLEKVATQYRERIATLQGDGQFYDLLSGFIAEFKDAHLGCYRPSSMSARLGFTVTRIDGKAIITAIDGETLKPETFPFKIGDEVIAIDGKPVEACLRDGMATVNNSREESALGQLTRSLTTRAGWRGPVPTGTVRVDIKPAGSNDAQTLMMTWIVKGKPLPGLSFFEGGGSTDGHAKPGPISLNRMANITKPKGGTPWLPDAAQMLEAKNFTAAMFDSPKGPLGYVKIPSFAPDDTDEALKELGGLLKSMRFTRGLVIDLNDNPGGSITYCFAIVGLLSDRPLALPTITQRANRRTLTTYRSWASGTTDTAQKAVYTFRAEQIEKALEAGLDFSPFGVGWGMPSQAPSTDTVYTKPILMLINEQCYSCGDMFPAVMRDNNRVTLLGGNTAGAGGNVSDYGPLSYSATELSVTESLMKRTSGGFIENDGIKPDIAYAHTQADAANHYKQYKKTYVEALLKLIP